MVTLQMIEDAAKALNGVAHETPITSVTVLNPNFFIKSENLQKTGSFKIRGAFNKIRSLTKEEAAKGVIACSAGNHSQGVALSATRLGIKSTICMPAGAPILKIEATKNYGADVVLVPGNYDDAQREAVRLSEEKGYTFVHPFNDPYVIAGQGTIGLEILKQMPDVEQVIVPIGGGGLISGVAVAIKSIKPDCKVIGVQSDKVPSMYKSFTAGKITTVPDAATIADGIHVLTPGSLTFEIIKNYVDEIVTVSEDEIAAAIVKTLEVPKLVSEGAGATTVAAFMFDKVDTLKKTVAVISGGNVDITTLSRIITRGLIRSGRMVTISTKISDKAGSLAELLNIIAANGANILSIDHEREDIASEVNSCVVSMLLETKDQDHVEKIRHAMETAGYMLVD